MGTENARIQVIFGKEMMLLRFIILAGVAVFIGLYAPMRATADDVAPTLSELSALELSAPSAEQKKDEVPRPRPTPGPRDSVFAADFSEKKAETPPRPRPKPGPKDGGEDE